jgi:hypothetical protein
MVLRTSLPEEIPPNDPFIEAEPSEAIKFSEYARWRWDCQSRPRSRLFWDLSGMEHILRPKQAIESFLREPALFQDQIVDAAAAV